MKLASLGGKLLQLALDPARAVPAASRAARIVRTQGLAGLRRRLDGDEGLGASVDYAEWVRRFDSPTAAELASLRTRAAGHARPTITVCDPTGRGGLHDQLLPPLEVLPGPLAASLMRARGDFTLVLDPRARLAPHALLVAAEALAADPRLDLLYADHDLLDEAGQRSAPFFKPAFDRDLLLALDFVSPFALIRSALARASACDSTYRLFLRASRRAPASHIGHLPHVLAHLAAGPAPSADEALQSVREHLSGAAAQGWSVEAGRVQGTRRVRPSLPVDPPLVSALIPTRDGLAVLERCVEGLLTRTRWPRLELLIIDNGSTDPATLRYLDGLTARGQASVLRDPGPFNFSRLNNLAARSARGDLLALLNNDLEVQDEDWLTELACHALRPEIGAVGARLLYPDGRLQHAGLATGVLGVAGHILRGSGRDESGPHGLLWTTRACAAVTGACLVVRRELYLRVAGMDEQRFAVAFNDVDFCLRLRALGYTNLWTPWAELIHHESWSRGADQSPERRARFEREIEAMHARHPDLARDPLYNPNLTLAGLGLQPADPPRVERPLATEDFVKEQRDLSVVVTVRAGGARLRETLQALCEQALGETFSLRLLDARKKPSPGGTPLLAALESLELEGDLAARLIALGVTLRAAEDRALPVLRASALALADAPLAVLLEGECTPESPRFLTALLAPLREDPDVGLVLGAQHPHRACDALGRRQLEALSEPLVAHPIARIADGAAGWAAWTSALRTLCACDLACAAIRTSAAERLDLSSPKSEPARAVDERFAQALLEAGWTRVFAPQARALRTFAAPAGERLSLLRTRAAVLKKHLVAAPAAALPAAPPPARPDKSALLTTAARLARGSARAAEVLRDEGPQAVLDRLRKDRAARALPWWHQHPYDLLREARRPVPPPRAAALSSPLHICFVVPAFYKGAGGHTTLFRLVHKLESFGHSCELVFTSSEGLLPQIPVQIRQLVQELFIPVKARCSLHRGGPLPDADVHVATHWDTAFVVDRRRRSGAAAYLVQDWEPGFFPIGTGSALVEETYRLGFHHVCAGPWLESRLRTEFSARASHFLLGVEPSDYFVPTAAPPPPAAGRIAVYLRPLTPRRGFELVTLALAEVKRRRPDLEICAYGCDPAALDLPFQARRLGLLSHAELRALYTSSTIGLSCSLSNYSLVPQEMMACGLPVVEVDAPSTRAVFVADRDVVLGPAQPLGLADALMRLLDDAGLQKELRQNGISRARSLTWEDAARQVEAGLRRAVASALGVDQK